MANIKNEAVFRAHKASISHFERQKGVGIAQQMRINFLFQTWYGKL